MHSTSYPLVEDALAEQQITSSKQQTRNPEWRGWGGFKNVAMLLRTWGRAWFVWPAITTKAVYTPVYTPELSPKQGPKLPHNE